MGNAARGRDSKMGFGLEAAYGTPVQAQHLLDFTKDNVIATYERIQSKAIRAGRARRKGAAGKASIGGSFEIEVGPVGGTGALLYAMFGKATVNGAIAPYTHTFTPASTGPIPISHSIVKGASIFTHSSKINELTFTLDQDAFLLAEFSLEGIREKIDAYSEARDTAVFATAAYPDETVDTFTFLDAEVTLNGTVTDDVRKFTAKLSNNLSEKRGLNRKRFGQAHDAGDFDADFTLDLYFSTDAELRRYMGVAADTLTPYEATTDILTGSVILTFQSGTNILKVTAPEVEFEAPAPAVEDDEYLMQTLTCSAVDNAAGHIKVELTTSDAVAAVTTLGTPIA